MAELTPWDKDAVALVGQAVLAPSSHNTQPWVFLLGEPLVDLFADRTRALLANDPEGRELSISCGCALLNLRAAAAARGFRTEGLLVPDANDPDWLARAAVTRGEVAEDAGLAMLAGTIVTRHTYRSRFQAREVAAEVVGELVAAAEAEGAWLRPVSGREARHRVAGLVAEGDAIQWADPEWRRELAAWMRPPHDGDGLSVPPLVGVVAQAVVRTFDIGGGVGAKDRDIAEASPLLAVLGTEGDRTRDWLVAGQALQRVLLTARARDLQASYLNQPIQVGALRPKLLDAVGASGSPQILLRLGYPAEPAVPAPRRPVEDVIQWA
ncbi:Acg family FMN-binding oxidoreductase [Thioalkalivibrio paradoxus]|uniref:Nitroreductase-like protein n=1 Tax=Thioalkalivibrio paradoxus ARh 1 TaxID=713585 RepID=W0DLE5_9GAMM|nr:hypothetical protein [Thioalkalivibrio paradoxus]AHE97685.1 nitroreductase-like protein [Thioalkalivibrio paradoxus ARh 1]